MKYILHSVFAFSLFFFFAAGMVSCSGEEPMLVEADGLESPADSITHTCRLIWEGGIQGFDGALSRAAQMQVKDGECCYLNFKVGNSIVDGKATYSASAGEWVLSYNGTLPSGTSSTCQVFYLKDVKHENQSVYTLSSGVLVCKDGDAAYTKGDGFLRLQANLVPASSRIRFKGEVGQAFTLSGISCFTAFDVKTCTLTSSEQPLQLTVGADGYTPFVHALPLAARMLTIFYDYKTFSTSCDSPILDAGRSGYMLLPTSSAHNGWSVVEVVVPTLSAVTMGVVSDVLAEVNARVLSVGNGTLLDAGFVYATMGNPTTASSRVSLGTSATLTVTLSGLLPTTTYYVRAYATNERGTNYGEEFSFTTTATPTVPHVNTGVASDVQANRAVVGGSIVNLGEVAQLTQYGHVWSTTPNPTTANSKTLLGVRTTIGDYSGTLTGLLPNTTYYVRAYATNSVGTSYGEQISFITPYGSVLLSSSALDLKYNSAKIRTTISELGGHTVAERGICWSAVSVAPGLSDNVVVASETTSTFTCALTGLSEKCTYYACAYIRTTSGKVFYGDVLTITTPGKDEQFQLGEWGGEELWSDDNAKSDFELEKGAFGEEEDWNN